VHRRTGPLAVLTAVLLLTAGCGAGWFPDADTGDPDPVQVDATTQNTLGTWRHPDGTQIT
jgi:hypothetical protein